MASYSHIHDRWLYVNNIDPSIEEKRKQLTEKNPLDYWGQNEVIQLQIFLHVTSFWEVIFWNINELEVNFLPKS